MPWHSLQPRGLPALTNVIRPYLRTCAAAAGPCGPGYAGWRNVAEGFHGECAALDWHWRPPGDAQPDGLVVTIAPTGKDRLSAIMVDAGEPTFGALLVESQDGRGGEIVDLYCCEAVRPTARRWSTARTRPARRRWPCG